ncbi:MAG: hypothetical protein K8R54_15960 [Bacteroidales bacterium]|nr:hypothetical protein [Bacteroidales bacterium]
MSEYTNKIIDYIDNNLSEDESDKFIINLDNNKELKDEFLLFQDINEYMKSKLLSESIESYDNFKQIEKEAKDDVSEFLLQGKTDNDVLDYLSLAFPGENNSVKNLIKEAEKEAEIKGINELANNWVSEYENEKEDEKEQDLISYIKIVNFGENKESKDFSSIENKKIKGRRRLYYWISSAAAILIIIFILNSVFNNIPKNEKIFAEYHNTPYELTGIQVRNAEQDINTVFEEATFLYKQNLYEKAFIKFNTLVSDNTNFVQALFYSGLAQFEAENYNKSALIFDKVISQFDEYEIESKWYLSLAYIKTNEFSKALPYLEDIAKQKNLYQEDAKKILKQIK